MKTQNRLTVAAAAGVDLSGATGWQAELDTVMDWLGPLFARSEPRRRVAAFVPGLLGGLPQVNYWSLSMPGRTILADAAAAVRGCLAGWGRP